MLTVNGAKFRTLDDFNLKGKRVLVRVDFNSPLVKGKVQMNDRIMEHALTLREIAKKGAAVVAIAHQGRPGDEDYLESMEQHARLASKFVKVYYVDDLLGSKAQSSIKSLKTGEVLLLKNVRSLKDEFKPSPNNKLVKTLTPLFDLFVNDAFSVSHRNQTSVTGFTFLPSCMGRLMEKELGAVKNLQNKSMIYVLGGAKPEDNIILAKNRKVKKVLSTGIFSLLCLSAKGYKLGDQDKNLDKRLVSQIRRIAKKIETPVDLAISEKGRKEIELKDLPVEREILDIGTKTIEKYSREIGKAKAVFLKGPAGKFEEKGFEKGTVELLRAISSSECFSLIGGGHSSHVMESFSLSKAKFSHVSLAGGALIAYLAGEKIPGLEAIKVK